MNLDPTVIRALRAYLAEIKELEARESALSTPIEAARGASARLRRTIADLDRQIAEAAPRPIAPDADRVEALIAGAEVPQIDRKDIDARATKSRLLSTQRQQITVDLSAVDQRVTHLSAEAAGLRGQRAQVELRFANELGEALFDAYKRDAIAFVARHTRPLLSVADRIEELTGTRPAYTSILEKWPNIEWPDSFAMDESIPRCYWSATNVVIWPLHHGKVVSRVVV